MFGTSLLAFSIRLEEYCTRHINDTIHNCEKLRQTRVTYLGFEQYLHQTEARGDKDLLRAVVSPSLQLVSLTTRLDWHRRYYFGRGQEVCDLWHSDRKQIRTQTPNPYLLT